jgi:hypothetical protein
LIFPFDCKRFAKPWRMIDVKCCWAEGFDTSRCTSKKKIWCANRARVYFPHIANNIRKETFKLKTLYEKTLKIFKFLNSSFIHWLNYWAKVPPDLFHGEICWTELSFPHSDSEFVKKVPLILKIQKFWVRHFL